MRNPLALTLVPVLAIVALSAAHVDAQDAAPVASTLRPDEPYTELPILTWQEELELQSTVRQVLFNAYLPMLARPTFYRGVHEDTVPNQVNDWNWQRPDVQKKLLEHQDSTDAQRRGHAALPDAEINALIGRKQAFRPEELEPLLTKSPRFEDLFVTLRRVQPLGGDTFRVDFDVKTKSSGTTETTSFDSIDLVRHGGTWLLPTKILLEVAPLARIRSNLTGAGATDVTALAGNFLLLAENQLKDIIPFDLPALPKL